MKKPTLFVVLAACILLFSICGSALAQTASLIRITDTYNWAVPSPDPTGIVFVPGANALSITDSEVEETELFSGSNMFQTELDGSVVELFSTLDFTPKPTGITIDPNNNHLFISMYDSPRRIFEINPGPDGIYRNTDDSITSFRTKDFNCFDAEGVTYNPVDEVLHIACGVANIIFTIDPGPNQLFDGVAPIGDDTVSSFDTSGLGLLDPEGIAYDTASVSLYAIGKPKSQPLHVTTDGQFIRTITLDSSLLDDRSYINLSAFAMDPQDGVGAPDVTTLRIPITLEPDDASEHGNGLMDLGNSILELVVDESLYYQVFLRFNDVRIPRDAGILSAFVQFQAAGTSDELAFLTLTVQDSDSPDVFSDSDYNISSRPRMAAEVTWLPPAWSAESLVGPDQQTPDLSHLIQDIVTGDGWVAGNSIVIFLESDGERLAEAREGRSVAAPELTVAFTTYNAAPSDDSGTNQYISVPDSAILNATVFDDGLPGVPGHVDLLWTVGTGPGPVVFSDPTGLATYANF